MIHEMKSQEIELVDTFICSILESSVNVMPKRIAKLIALYYTDARIRKLYSKFIGLNMGEGTYANLGLKVVPSDNEICVEIGKYVSIAPNVVFVCNSSANNGKEINEIEYVSRKLTKTGNIVVEDDVWIGANVVILPNVRVGKCSVIGAGSVVVYDVEPYSIYAGTPAVKIRDLKTGESVKQERG